MKGCGARFRKPVTEISDRAKRYRANTPECRPRAPKKCFWCKTTRGQIVPDHRDGNESNTRPGNLVWACKSCNTKRGKAMAKAVKGVRTRQYNPKRKRRNPGATNLAQYVMAATEHSRGAHDAGGKVLHETPKSKRKEFAKEIWWRRGYRNPITLRGAQQELEQARIRLMKAKTSGEKKTEAKEVQFWKDMTAALAGNRPFGTKNPPADVMQEFRAGKLRDSAGRLVERTKAGYQRAKAILLSELRRAGRIPARNPDGSADDAYKTFHGKAPDKTKVLQVALVDPFSDHTNLWQLGKLKSLTVGEYIDGFKGSEGDQPQSNHPDAWAETIYFDEGSSPDLAGEPGGRELFIVGGNQKLGDAMLERLGADSGKDAADLGFIYRIEYFTRKDFDRFQPINYWHHFGEETGVQPRLFYDRTNHRMQLAGGEYVVKREGIVN